MKGSDNLCRLRILKAVIFRTGLDNISLHFKNISNKARLDDNLTTEDFSVVYQDMHILKKDKGLAALTLLVAESDPKQKETLIRLIMHMLKYKQDK